MMQIRREAGRNYGGGCSQCGANLLFSVFDSANNSEIIGKISVFTRRKDNVFEKGTGRNKIRRL